MCRALTLQWVMQISVLGASPPWYKSRSAAQQNFARQNVILQSSIMQCCLILRDAAAVWAAPLQHACRAVLHASHQHLGAVAMPLPCCVQELLCSVCIVPDKGATTNCCACIMK